MAGGDPSGLLTTGFRQMAYVTNDIDRAVAIFGERHGVHRFLVIRDMAAKLASGTGATMHLALAKAGGIEIELIQPIDGDDRVWREILRGDAGFEMHFHHEAQSVGERGELDRLRALALARGFAISVEGGSNAGAAFFYIDCRETLGHHVEYLYFPEAVAAEFAAAIPVN